MGALNPAEVEQTKLLANAFDRASTACVTVGIVTPLAGYLYNFPNFNAISGGRMAVYLAGWLLSAVLLHYMARRILRRLA
ncbi:hypothetical protein [Neorhizobium huautlense]|jgi:hypothetical protein|uniref:hypothetical protein n=1 Tax=Neorhizobium huautlense TaxID=67774 RepID=UPI000CF84D24|nr:hypothetical protein [Neorhizobium huautlense]